MSAVTMQLNGGERFKEQLLGLARGLGRARVVRVGFLEGSTYPAGDGGARLAAAARRAQKAGKLGWHRLLMVWARWAYKHPGGQNVPTVAFWNEFGTSTSKARPFFRSMIAKKSGEWGAKLARYLRSSGFDSRAALTKLGLLIGEQLQESIMSWPGDNRPLTTFVKGFNRGLVDHAVMARSVDFEVVE